ncbi:hypothetical protein PAAG_11245 [Paracoccidioides lutzii Pb01]|uniref:Uncharacterized protein n=1 Tax=Paracoccidioides lutzii (strain ATCC MYA-826 / Pb01) TaxID=502779 RepID=A0A0A2VMJ4_PARBA|nr:hypothetical protein PAAG_11245 [Paracoccidioides lutzii Pb01]KGQ02064.1 hypothetical protein PAAG_11245 [Paracoccidioides lutzii Pb01]
MALVMPADQGKSFSQCSALHNIQAMGPASGTDREHTKELLIVIIYINQLASSVVGNLKRRMRSSVSGENP